MVLIADTPATAPNADRLAPFATMIFTEISRLTSRRLHALWRS